MKKRTKRFDAGGMASSGPQPAFYQPRTPVGTDTGVGGVAAAPLPGPLNLGQQQQPQQPVQMKKGGKVKTKRYDNGGDVIARQLKEGDDIINRIIAESRKNNPSELSSGFRSSVPRPTAPKTNSLEDINKRLNSNNISPAESSYLLELKKQKEFEEFTNPAPSKYARGGKVKPKTYASGGAVKKSRGDGCAQRGKTRGTMR